MLLRAMLTSLVLSNTASTLRLFAIDLKGSTFAGKLAEVAQLRRPPVREYVEAVELLQSLVRLMETPREEYVSTVLFIDELADLVMLG